MLTKTINRLIVNKAVLIPLFTRYSLYSVALVESFILPKLIDGYQYSQFEYYKNFIFLFPNFLLGSYSGYIYLKYVHKIDYYKQLFQVGAIISTLLAIIGTLITNNLYLLIPLVVFNLYTLVEQKLKVGRKFVPIFAFKPILSVISVLIAILTYYYSFINYNYNLVILIVFGFGFLLWVIIFRLKTADLPVSLKFNKTSVLRYTLMIKVIVTGVLASFLFSLMIFFERFYVKEYYADYLPTYSMAFNLSQIIAVILSAVSYVSSVELGERLETINKIKLLRNFKNAIYVFIVFLSIFSLFVHLIHPIYKKFDFLEEMTFILTYSKGFFFLVSTISPLAVYHNFNTPMFLFLLKLFTINVLLTFFLIYFNTNVFILLILDSAFIIVYSLYILNIVFRKINYIAVE